MLHVALLRGINVSGKNKIPMAALRELASDLGLGGPETYIQSGNLVFETTDDARPLEASLEAAIQQRFGLSIPVIVRPGRRLVELAAGSPFSAAEAERPNLLHFAASKLPPRPDADTDLQKYLAAERIQLVDDGLWIDYAGGVGRSKLSPAVLDRCVGSPVTARNWRTVLQLAAMVQARSS